MKRTSRLTINDKDKKLFSYLHSIKIARRDQIARDTYQGLAKWGLSKRLYRLEKAGYLRGFISSETNNFKVYSLTKKSFSRFLAYGDEKRKELRSDAIKHDLTLVDVRHAIFDSPLVTEYLTENTLQTWKLGVLGDHFKPFAELNSDAALKITSNGQSYYCALEYESAGKSISRYHNVLTRYYDAFEIPLILYIFESEEALKRAKKTEETGFKNKTPKFFYTTHDNLIQLRNLNFKNRRNEILPLGTGK